MLRLEMPQQEGPKWNLYVQGWTAGPAQKGVVWPATAAPTGPDLSWARRRRGHLGSCGILRPDPDLRRAAPWPGVDRVGERDWDPHALSPAFIGGRYTVAFQVTVLSFAPRGKTDTWLLTSEVPGRWGCDRNERADLLHLRS